MSRGATGAAAYLRGLLPQASLSECQFALERQKGDKDKALDDLLVRFSDPNAGQLSPGATPGKKKGKRPACADVTDETLSKAARVAGRGDASQAASRPSPRWHAHSPPGPAPRQATARAPRWTEEEDARLLAVVEEHYGDKT